MANRPSRIEIQTILPSTDGLYHGRYPFGNSPTTLRGNILIAAAATGSLARRLKWIPQHWMLSNETDRSSSGQTANILLELSALGSSGANVQGYAYEATWDTLEPSFGNYDFSHIDNVLANLPSGKKLIICVQTGYAPSNHVPSYIRSNSIYGASPTAGEYGYWTGFGGASYFAAKWRSSVMGRWAALFQALGDRYDSDARVAALIDHDETANSMDAGSDYTAASFLTQWTNFGALVVPHAPQTNVVQQINWTLSGNEQAYFAAMYANRVAFGGPDIFGASANAVDYVNAQAVYRGDIGGFDYRGPKMPMIHDVQSPEMTGGLGTFTPQDIFNNANGNYSINWILWNYLPAGLGGPGGNGEWFTSVLPVINANPVSTTGYPFGDHY